MEMGFTGGEDHSHRFSGWLERAECQFSTGKVFSHHGDAGDRRRYARIVVRHPDRPVEAGSTVPVLKLLVQQSNCFVIVERGRAMNNIMGERALEQSGEMRKGSNFGKGQMVAADYSMSPSITFSNNNAGGAGAAIGGRLGSVGALLGGSMNRRKPARS